MNDKVIKLEEYLPHLATLLDDGNALVVPARYIEELISRKQKLVITQDNEPLIRHIIKEWYESIKSNNHI